MKLDCRVRDKTRPLTNLLEELHHSQSAVQESGYEGCKQVERMRVAMKLPAKLNKMAELPT